MGSLGEFRKTGHEPDAPIALPHLFKKNGYKTIGIGKITHEPGGVMDEAQSIAQIPFSWDTTYTAVGKWKHRGEHFLLIPMGMHITQL